MESHKFKVQSRFNVIVNYHMLAYLLYSKYIELKLTHEQEEKAKKSLYNINPKFVLYVISFEARMFCLMHYGFIFKNQS